MFDQATALRGLMERRQRAPLPPIEVPAAACRTIAVTSGKGGVGKSSIALNLSIALAEMTARVCLLDANLGLGNIDLLCGLNGYWNLSHVVTGARTLSEIVLDGPAGVHVVPGASGLGDLADCSSSVQREILNQLEALEQAHDFLVIDTGTGIHRLARQLVAASDLALIVTTAEPTAIADAYATIKLLSAGEHPEIEVLVNQADSSEQARQIADRLQQTARLFLRTEIKSAGCVPRDHHVATAVAQRHPFILGSRSSPASVAVERVARRIRNVAEKQPPRSAFFARMWQRCVSGKAA